MFKEEVQKTVEVLKNGGVILYPTDTVWGLGCDATNMEAVAKINAIKGRTPEKSFIVLLQSENQLQSYVNEIPDVAYELIEYAENPLTIVFSGAKNLAKNVINEDGSVGIRVVRHKFCEEIIQRLRKPITSTSANKSGDATPRIFDDISEEILQAVDHVVNLEQEIREVKRPSTIIKLGPSGQFEFIRK
ncbi:MAG: L-threonylcarbamoyladenylate synthase [Bacteroidia bacterium]